MCLHHKHHLTRPTKGSEEGVGRFLVEAKGGEASGRSLSVGGKGDDAPDGGAGGAEKRVEMCDGTSRA